MPLYAAALAAADKAALERDGGGREKRAEGRDEGREEGREAPYLGNRVEYARNFSTLGMAIDRVHVLR